MTPKKYSILQAEYMDDEDAAKRVRGDVDRVSDLPDSLEQIPRKTWLSVASYRKDGEISGDMYPV